MAITHVLDFIQPTPALCEHATTHSTGKGGDKLFGLDTVSFVIDATVLVAFAYFVFVFLPALDRFEKQVSELICEILEMPVIRHHIVRFLIVNVFEPRMRPVYVNDDW